MFYKYLPLAYALLSLALTLALGLLLAGAADTLGFMDHPDPRKVHDRSTPRTGGLAMALGGGMTLALAVACGWQDLPAWPWQTVVAGAGFFGTGLLDDRFSFNPRSKFFIFLSLACLAAWPWALAARAGVAVGPFHWFPPAPLRFALFAFWFMAVPNAVNIEDAINGYMGGFALILLAAAAFLGLDTWIAMGALVGFLVLNWPRATHFLGDAGSFGCGFLLAEALLRGGGVNRPLQALVLTAPLSMDVAMGLVRRRRLGMSPFTPDRQTLPHHLLARFKHSTAPVLWAHALVCALLAGRPTLAVPYLALFGLVLVGLNRAALFGPRKSAPPPGKSIDHD
jgi:UDP-GlcNAc:undecaprenyl-phosphate/decaprenyl-phosphate GlcNAc-1-phosphate transferase